MKKVDLFKEKTELAGLSMEAVAVSKSLREPAAATTAAATAADADAATATAAAAAAAAAVTFAAADHKCCSISVTSQC